MEISIHALLAESDNRYGRPIDLQLVFLSTLSLRRATHPVCIFVRVIKDFYPRSPCGERQSSSYSSYLEESISIHALLAESDLEGGSFRGISSNFYPRSPCGERHLTERLHWQVGHFYPRSPCGERRTSLQFNDMTQKFLSTLSLRRATPEPETTPSAKVISIHALLAESDLGLVFYRHS